MFKEGKCFIFLREEDSNNRSNLPYCNMEDLFGVFGDPAYPLHSNLQIGFRGNNLFHGDKSSTKGCLVFVFLWNGFSLISPGTFHLLISRKP